MPRSSDKLFRRWGRRINARRRAMDERATQLNLAHFRSHCMRHGCVHNLKRQRVAPSDGAAHVCMSLHMWETVYGMEVAEEVGARVTAGMVGRKRPRSYAGDV